uniref:C6 transcription factor n=1 Tax=Ustilago esculenta TaxID=185366 RepID=A0A481SHA1_9BASI|nr:C6 transcription factor [Ustilago esculenta]
MSSVQPQHGWLGETFNYTHDSAQLPYRDVYGASQSYVQTQSRTNSRPRVNMACKHCRQSVAMDLVADAFTPLSTGVDLVREQKSSLRRWKTKVTAEENAVLRDKKRQSKLRKNAEQEAARTNFHQHDTFPAYHPYRSAIVASRNTFGSDDRVGLQPPPLPHVGGSTSSLVPPYLYDGKYSSTSTVGVGLFDVGAGLNGSRRPSIKGLLAGRTVSSGVACAPKQSLEGYTRSSEPQSCYDAVIDSLSDPNFSTSLNINTAPTTTTTAFATLTFSDANSFRPDETDIGVRYAQRYIGAAAFIPQSEYEVASPIYPECFDRERSSISTISGSPSVASPSYIASLPALECRPSSSVSGASASPTSIHPETTPQHDDASHWPGHQPIPSSGYAQNPLNYHRAYEQARVENPYHEHTFPSSGGDSSSASVNPWTKHVPMGAATHLAVGNKAWDSVVSLYSTTI